MPKLRVSRMLNLKQHSSLKTPRLLFSLFILSTLTLSGLALFKQTNPITHALDNNFSNGITVDSTLDTPDDNIGDGICDDGSGNCTLRAAIQEANSDPDASTILFNISGTPDFTNNSQDGYTIKPQSALPEITEQLTINGYSQPGASPNTAPAPQPLNGTLLIEVDGEDTASGDGFGVRGNNTTIKGLSIVGFSDHNAIGNAADGLTVQGNYIGVDHTGMAAKANACGLCQLADGSEDALIGGLDAEDRNIISGNTGTASSSNTNSHHWVYQGNYIGVGANGLTAIPNAQPNGSGALSLDNSNGHVVGGSQPGAINVISGNLGHGIAPHNSDDLLIEGNYIGLAYDGTTILGNTDAGYGAGIALSSSSNVIIKNNRVAGWNAGGIDINSENNNVTIEGNISHDNKTGNLSVNFATSDVLIKNNTIYNSALTGNIIANVTIAGIAGIPGFGSPDHVVLQSNKIGFLPDGTPSSSEITLGILIMGSPTNILIGGTEPGQGNTIYGQKNAGVGVSTLSLTAAELSIHPNRVSILGNSITGTQIGQFGSNGLGVDIFESIDTDTPPDGQPNTFNNLGPTPNDSGDPDTGPNNYINFPVLNSVTQDGTTATINFNLDAADSPTNQYRIEFFANDQADPSGYGEGQTYLGYTTVSNGTNQQATLTLPSNLNLASKHISATTTAIDNTTTSGFGSTSEFSPLVTATSTTVSTPTTTPTNLASTGQSNSILMLFSVLSLLGSTWAMVRRISF